MENTKRKKSLECIFLCILIFLLAGLTKIPAQTSTNYIIKKHVVDQGGGVSSSTSYTLNDAVGQPSPVGVETSTNYKESSGFFGGGIISTGVEEKNHGKTPLTFKLFQNYPNPFNPTTTIQYSLREESKVALVIYNLKGSRVCKLVDREEPAGFYRVEWNGRDESGRVVGSGIYIYRIVVRSRKQSYINVKKIIFMK